MTPEEFHKALQLKETLLDRDVVYRHLAHILSESLNFHTVLWSKNLRQRAKNEHYMKKHPREARARERSANLFLSKYLLPPEPTEALPSPRDVTAEKLDEMQLSDDALKKLAGIDEPKTS